MKRDSDHLSDDEDHKDTINMPKNINTKFLRNVMETKGIIQRRNKKEQIKQKHVQFKNKKQMVTFQQEKGFGDMSFSFNSQYSQQSSEIFDAVSKIQELKYRKVHLKGGIIEGTWKRNKPHGNVTVHYISGEQFVGKYFNGKKVFGKVTFPDGFIYEGGFYQEKFNGRGLLTDPDKRIITAEWSNGVMKKEVIIQYPTGDMYIGEVKNFKKNGRGKLMLKNGGVYEGYFSDGTINGMGKYFKNGELIASGFWVNGVFQSTSSNISNILTQTLKVNVSELQTNIQSSGDIQKISAFTSISDILIDYQN